MTRETKVGLLVGLGIILLIGIIVSDHLSVAQRQSEANLTDLARQTQRSIAPIPIQSRTNENTRAIPAPQTLWGGNTNTQRTRPLPMPAELAPPPGPPQRLERQPRPRHDTLVSTNHPPTQGPRLANGTPSAMPTLSQTHAGQPEGDTTPRTHSAARQTSATPKPRAMTPQPMIHYVKAGESLWQIAQQYYDNGEHWRTLAQANSDRVGANGAVRQGVRLVVPNKAGLADPPSMEQIIANRVDPTQTRLASSPPTAGGRQAVNRVIEVEPGDSLSLLAHQHLGSSDRWRELFDANRDKLKKPNAIQIGMKLRLPSANKQNTSAVSPRLTANRSKTGTYVVKSSDSLSSIAQKTLGDPNRWEEIFEANRKRLNDPNDIQVGQRLTIPTR